MLKANKNALFEKIFAVYNRNLLRRRFHSFRVSGFDLLLNKNDKLPLIIYCNHSSWWDGLTAFQISYETGLYSYLMMEEKQLKALFPFRLLGAFSVVRDKPREALKSLDYAVKTLKTDPNNTLWIFPQGEILPNDLRPLKFYNGLAKIIKKLENCAITSLSMRYEFLGEFKPQIFVKVQEPEIITVDENFEIKTFTKKIVCRSTENLDGLKQDVINQDFNNYKQIF